MSYFFTADNDERGNVYMSLFTDNAVYPINYGLPNYLPDNAKLVMLAKNFINRENMDDTDIHYEWTDFIIKTALYHKKINNKYIVLVKLNDFIKYFIDSEKYNKSNIFELKNDANNNILFGKSLPFLPNKYTKIWLNKDKYILVEDCPTFFQQLYQKVYDSNIGKINICGNEIIIHNQLNIIKFNIKIDDSVNRILSKTIRKFEESMSVLDWTEYIKNNFWGFNNDDYYNNIDNKKKILTDKDNKKILNYKNNCSSTMLNFDEKECREYVTSCLYGNNLNNLEACIKKIRMNPNLLDIVKQEINNIHPEIAIHTLEKFGFKIYTTYDTFYGKDIRKIERVKNWINNYLAHKFSQKQIENLINENRSLLDYFDLLSQYINQNPNLLNPDLKISNKYDRSIKLIQTGGQNLKLNFANKVISGGGDLIQLKNGLIGIIMQKYRLPEIPIEHHSTCGSTLYDLFKDTLNDLRNKKINVSNTDLSKIEDHIKSIINLEKELLKHLVYLEEFNKLYETLGKDKRINTQVLTLENLEKIINTYNSKEKKYSDKQQYLLNLLNKLNG